MYQQHVPVAPPVHYVPLAEHVETHKIDDDPNPSFCDIFTKSYHENQGAHAKEMGAAAAKWSRRMSWGVCCVMIILLIVLIDWLASLN